MGRVRSAVVEEAQAVQDLRRPGGRAFSADGVKVGMDLGLTLGGRGLGQVHQLGAAHVQRQDRVDQQGGGGCAHASWSTVATRQAFGDVDLARRGVELAQDQAEQGRLADAVAAHDAGLHPHRNRDRGVVEEPSAPRGEA